MSLSATKRTAFWSGLCLLFTAGTAPSAPLDDPAHLYEGDRFAVVVEEVASGIHLMRREPSWRLPVQANTILIVNEADAILIDGGFGAHAEHVVREVRRITDKPVSAIITTHWHGDHNVGHYVFRRAWPLARIIAHEKTRAEMVGGKMDYVRRTAQADPEALVAPLRERLRQLRSEQAPPELIAYTSDSIAGLPEVRADYAQWAMVPADETFSDRLVLHRGDRLIELLHFGAANTQGDAIIWLPQERVVITGDVVVRPTPYGFGSSPRSWANVLRQVKRLDYALLIPGHGDVQRDTDHLVRLEAMLESIADQACSAISNGVTDADSLRDDLDFSSFEPGFTGGDPLLTRLFEVWFKRPIAEGALAEAKAGKTCA